jgi:HAD superfamily hydrolase (TIGR01458 family)
MADLPRPTQALLLDIDGVLHVGGDPVPGAIDSLGELREAVGGVRLLTNTTSRSRAAIVAELRELGFAVGAEEVLTPAALAVTHCREAGYERIELMVGDSLREDLAGLEVVEDEAPVDAIVLGDIGAGFDAASMNRAFRRLMDGAALIALQHNRYWRSGKGMTLDVGAWSAALEYAAGVEAIVIGKPSRRFYEAALADLGVGSERALMIGDDVEADVGGGLDAGIASVLVRTGKYSDQALAASGVEPTLVIDSIASMPGALTADDAPEPGE